MSQLMQFGLFFAAVAAIAVCGCIFMRKPTKKLPVDSLRADERQPGCFALEEERGGNWTGSGVPVIKEARPSL
jgi:hypothetical protein